MTANGGGNIVNVASISGLTADANGTLYGASKAGVINLTKYIATQMGKKNIRCNAVAPGLVLTCLLYTSWCRCRIKLTLLTDISASFYQFRGSKARDRKQYN